MFRQVLFPACKSKYDSSIQISSIFYYFLLNRNEVPPLPASFNIHPTDTVQDKLEIKPVKGIQLTLYHAPGETNDQIIVWWPQKRMLFPADNIYKAFPNLYAIRGTSAR
jgi:glyoxylase-like metal-dependent hydrolase (beta-lactamase superfamily II)